MASAAPSPPPSRWPPPPIRNAVGVPLARSAAKSSHTPGSGASNQLSIKRVGTVPRPEARGEVERRPMRIVARRMRDLLFEQRMVLTRDVQERVAHREVVERLQEHALLAFDRVGFDLHAEATPLRVEEVRAR